MGSLLLTDKALDLLFRGKTVRLREGTAPAINPKPDGSEPYLEDIIAQAQLDKIKKAGWVQLDENQELPKKLLGESNMHYCAGYYEAQQGMLNAGFRRVKRPDPRFFYPEGVVAGAIPGERELIHRTTDWREGFSLDACR